LVRVQLCLPNIRKGDPKGSPFLLVRLFKRPGATGVAGF
jgi:hypothetical protein